MKNNNITPIEVEVLHLLIPVINTVHLYADFDELDNIIESEYPLDTIKEILENKLKTNSNFNESEGYNYIVKIYNEIYNRIKKISKSLKNGNSITANMSNISNYPFESLPDLNLPNMRDIDNPNKILHLVPQVPKDYIRLIENIFEVYLISEPSLYSMFLVLLSALFLHYSISEHRELCNISYTRKELDILLDEKIALSDGLFRRNKSRIYRDTCTDKDYVILDLFVNRDDDECYVILENANDLFYHISSNLNTNAPEYKIKYDFVKLSNFDNRFLEINEDCYENFGLMINHYIEKIHK